MSFKIKKQEIHKLSLVLGYSYLSANKEETQIEEYIVIEPKKNYSFWSKKLTTSLNTGIIRQSIYDVIINNENEARQAYLINENVSVAKSDLIDLIVRYGINDIEQENSLQIIKALNTRDYQIIKKI
tara:strand:+ start:168 stop:548 length:381 start_codon:yes stop_codon:yes gene_type:complete